MDALQGTTSQSYPMRRSCIGSAREGRGIAVRSLLAALIAAGGLALPAAAAGPALQQVKAAQRQILITDAQPDSITLQRRETISVPVDGHSVTSEMTLQSGRLYLLRAAGTFYIGAYPSVGDAEYAYDPASGHIQLHCANDPSQTELGIGVNDSVPDSNKFPHWGPFNQSHVYVIGFVGKGAPITLNYHDCNYADNTGALSVAIYGPVPQ